MNPKQYFMVEQHGGEWTVREIYHGNSHVIAWCRNRAEASQKIDQLYSACVEDSPRETWIIESCTETDEYGEPLYWSNRDGWVHRDDAERFDEPVDVLLVGDYRHVRLDP